VAISTFKIAAYDEMTPTDELSFAADFAPASYDDWRKLVDGAL